jgi:hypothetical protein
MSADNVTSLLTLVVALFGSYAAVATLFYHIGKDVGSKGNKKDDRLKLPASVIFFDHLRG